jgi:hypothetical protein
MSLPAKAPKPAPVMLQVTIPAGMGPGAALTVQAPDGRLFSVTVPAGSRAGDVLSVDVSEAGQGEGLAAGTTVTAAGTAPRPADSEDRRTSKAALGAAAVGAVVGTLLIGPITGGGEYNALPL